MVENSFHLLHAFVVLLLCLETASGFNSGVGGNAIIGCIEKEREALLKLKHGLVDDYGHLSSWGSEYAKRDCCRWRGIKCSNRTGHVIKLDLHVAEYYSSLPYKPLRGKISPSLLELHHLNYLDLSNNDLGGSHIPMFIGYLTKLRHLDLSLSNFGGTIPYQLGNLTNLHYLGLEDNGFLNAENLEWLSHLSSLRLLDMSFVDLSKVRDWLQTIKMLPSLSEFYLPICQLTGVVPPSLSFVNSSTSLAVLDLSHNFLSSSIYHWLFNFSGSLAYVHLSGNDLQSSIPDAFQNMKSLAYLGLGHNGLEGSIPKFFGNFCTLGTLELYSNNFSEELPKFVQNLSGCTANSLETLELFNNELSGSLPDMTRFSSLRELNLARNRITGPLPNLTGMSSLIVLRLGANQFRGPLPDLTGMSSLRVLELGWNQFNGTLPEAIGQLSKLESLDVSSNCFEGIISVSHLLNLPKLQFLELSFNSLSLNLSSHWVPPFQLDTIGLGACKLGPHFPKWLQTQKTLSSIDISSNGISDSIPNWFWDLSPRLTSLNLSCNKFSGRLPNLSLKFSGFLDLDLSSNQFNGPLPLFPSNLTSLDLSTNMFSGSISSLCEITRGALTYIDLSNNHLSEGLPTCWMQFRELVILNLANNNFSGKIPSSISSLYQMKTLHLRQNSFFGELPLTLKNCTQLNILDMGENKLTGKIPSWIGESLSQLVVLSLRSNEFYGSIPGSLCHLIHIQILDLSINNISGNIPQCLNNFTAMTAKGNLNETISYTYVYTLLGDGRFAYARNYLDNALVVLKGLQLEYSRNLGLVTFINLSTNKLIGEIPKEIASLTELIALNLSRNNLRGRITPKISQLKKLESLDLSQNQLFGEIPASLSTLHFLAVLNLSKNNFSGKIPTGPQLQTFNASAFMGNLDLCGPPLPNKCLGDETAEGPSISSGSEDSNIEENEDGFITQGFYVSMGLGFALGFWGVCGTLLFKRSWGYAYFQILNKIKDWLYVTLPANTARLQGRLRG